MKGSFTEHTAPPCEMTETQYSEALTKVQQFFKINETGVCDTSTRNKMAVPRCGNRDNESDVPAKVAQSQLPPNASEAEEAGQWNDTVPSGYERRGRRSVHMDVLDDIEEEPVPPVDRFKLTQEMDLDDIVPSQQIIQEQKPVSLLQSLLRRDKRSTTANRTGFPPKSWVQQIKFSKKVITWKFIDGGLSTRLTEDEQRQAVAQAFRMWSEVTPLKFVQVFPPANGVQVHVDIEVAFATSKYKHTETTQQ